MTEKELYQKWLECATDDADLQTELKAIAGDDNRSSITLCQDCLRITNSVPAVSVVPLVLAHTV